MFFIACSTTEAGWSTNARFDGFLRSSPLDEVTRDSNSLASVAGIPFSSDRFETVLVRTKIQSILSEYPSITRTQLRDWAKLVNFVLLRYARNRRIHLPIKIDTYRKDRIDSQNFSDEDFCVKYVCTNDCVVPVEYATLQHSEMHSFATPIIQSSSYFEREKCIMLNCKGLLFQYLGTRGSKQSFRPREVVVSLKILTLFQNVYADRNFRELLWTETVTLDTTVAGFVYDITDTKQW